jgi:soluble lytic murein transglycosylase
MNQENHFTPYSDIGPSLRLFTLTGSQYHQDHFNHTLDPETLIALAGSKNFGALSFSTITDPKMDKLQESLALINVGSFDGQTHFYLGINALKYKQPQSALFHLKEAYGKVYTPIDKDKATFWLYQTTQEQTYLDTLANSLDLNMYALWGKEKSGVVPRNYFTTLPMTQAGGFAGDNPFEWNELHKEITSSTKDNVVNLIERYSGEDSLAVQAYIIERTYTPFIHNYTMPYDQYMTELSIDQKAMLYALMRQETRMIPGLISRSFALGAMQIMPFNVDTISKAHPLKITSYADMFNPKYNIAYAISHMKHIDNTLYNPVLKAYAYNGGLGLTKRHILNNGQFLVGNYEPFMSMELVGNHENREYGKRVLANYVIYKKILGEEVSITSLFDSLAQPALSDCFRAKALMPLPAVSQSE